MSDVNYRSITVALRSTCTEIHAMQLMKRISDISHEIAGAELNPENPTDFIADARARADVLRQLVDVLRPTNQEGGA